MKTKKFNRIISLAASFLLILSMLAVSGFAIEKNTGKITVNGAEAKLQVTAYKIIDVQYDYTVDQPSEPLYIWVTEAAEWIKTNYPAYINADNNSVTEAFNKSLDAETAAAFYDDLANAIRNKTDITLSSSNKATTSDEGSAVIDNLPMGTYLVLIENGMKVYRPSAVNLIPEWKENKWEMTDATVQLKSSEPSVSKDVVETDKIGTGAENKFGQSASAGIGEKVTFRITSEIPKYPENALDKTYSVSDFLPASLTYESSSLKVKAGDGTLLSAGVDYNTGTSDKAGRESTFTVDFIYDRIKTYSTVVIEYEATVNKNAVIGNPNINEVNLDYSNNPYEDGSYKTKTDDAEVYAFGIKLIKHEKDREDVLLAGAEFNLSASPDNSSPIAFIKTAEGEYRVAEAGESSTVTVIETAADGHLTVKGLDEGTWYLTETKAPDGYVKLSTPVTVTIEGEKNPDGSHTGKAVIDSENTSADGIISIKVSNRTGFLLPPTGGAGTIIFTASGILLLGLGAFIIIKNTRKKKEF